MGLIKLTESAPNVILRPDSERTPDLNFPDILLHKYHP